MDEWIVYIVRCADHSLYCGIAKDVEDRIRQHNTGKGAKYTKARLPVTLCYTEQVKDRSSALKREYEIKSLTRCEKLRLIKAYDDCIRD